MFHVGIGGSGKTTFINLIKAAITSVYFKDLPIDTFDSIVTAKRTFSTVSPNVRFLFVSEMSRVPKNSSVIKTICDGVITVPKMYQDGSFDIPINAKLMATSNNAIVFDEDDSGILRRVQGVFESFPG
jgi:phage/plasmid-associated DNA primase